MLHHQAQVRLLDGTRIGASFEPECSIVLCFARHAFFIGVRGHCVRRQCGVVSLDLGILTIQIVVPTVTKSQETPREIQASRPELGTAPKLVVERTQRGARRSASGAEPHRVTPRARCGAGTHGALDAFETVFDVEVGRDT